MSLGKTCRGLYRAIAVPSWSRRRVVARPRPAACFVAVPGTAWAAAAGLARATSTARPLGLRLSGRAPAAEAVEAARSRCVRASAIAAAGALSLARCGRRRRAARAQRRPAARQRAPRGWKSAGSQHGTGPGVGNTHVDAPARQIWVVHAPLPTDVLARPHGHAGGRRDQHEGRRARVLVRHPHRHGERIQRAAEAHRQRAREPQQQRRAPVLERCSRQQLLLAPARKRPAV